MQVDVVPKISKGFLVSGGFLCRVASYKWGGLMRMVRDDDYDDEGGGGDDENRDDNDGGDDGGDDYVSGVNDATS